MSTLSGGHVSVTWPDYPGSPNHKAVTFEPNIVQTFRQNDVGEQFNIPGSETITPDFIYIEEPQQP